MDTTSNALMLTNQDPTIAHANGTTRYRANGSPINAKKAEKPKKTVQNATQTTEQLPVTTEPARHPDEQTLTDGSCSLYLFASTLKALNVSGSPEGFLQYRERFLHNCGSPTDPIEVMLIENLMLAHHSAGRLLVLSANEDQCDAATAYSMAGTKLMAEERRSALALQEYRGAQAAQLKRATAGQESGTVAPSPVQQKAKTPKKPKVRPPKPQAQGTNGAANGKCCPIELTSTNSIYNGDSKPWTQKRFEFQISDESKLVAATSA